MLFIVNKLVNYHQQCRTMRKKTIGFISTITQATYRNYLRNYRIYKIYGAHIARTFLTFFCLISVNNLFKPFHKLQKCELCLNLSDFIGFKQKFYKNICNQCRKIYIQFYQVSISKNKCQTFWKPTNENLRNLILKPYFGFLTLENITQFSQFQLLCKMFL